MPCGFLVFSGPKVADKLVPSESTKKKKKYGNHQTVKRAYGDGVICPGSNVNH